jgi:hypothetical protein
MGPGGSVCLNSGFDKTYSAWSNAAKVHLAYLGTMAGRVGECCIDVLMREFNRKPIMHHWVLLAARFFMTLKCMPDDRPAHCAWVADIDLMMAGCRTCWTQSVATHDVVTWSA